MRVALRGGSQGKTIRSPKNVKEKERSRGVRITELRRNAKGIVLKGRSTSQQVRKPVQPCAERMAFPLRNLGGSFEKSGRGGSADESWGEMKGARGQRVRGSV